MAREFYDRVYLLNIDPQVDFMPGGALAAPGGDSIIDPINEASNWTRNNRGQVVFSRDQHREDTPHFEKFPPHCVAGTPGAEFHPRLVVKPEVDIIINKGTGDADDFSIYDGFTDDDQTLEEIVMPKPATKVALMTAGGVAEWCVDAADLGNHQIAEKAAKIGAYVGVYILKDAVSALTPEGRATAFERFTERGTQVITVNQLITGGVLRVRR